MYKIDYNSENNIHLLTVNDSLSINEVEAISKELYTNLKGNKFYLLTDVRNVKYKFDVKELKQIVNITNEYHKDDVTIYEAILINTPAETAKSILYDSIRNSDSHICRIFYTKSAAIDWLLDNKF